MNKPDLNKPCFKVMPGAALKINSSNCPTCGKSIVEAEFKDALSVKEFGISGMCQACQDSIFG